MPKDQKQFRSVLAVAWAARTGIAVALFIAAVAAMAAPEPYDRGPGMMWSWGWPGMIFGPLFMLFVLVLMIVAVVLAVRWFAAPGAPSLHCGPAAQRALDILDQRFARGEIDQAEYLSKRRMILQP